MVASRKTSTIFGALICLILASTNASAVTADVAKKCSALTAKAFPQRNTGNPASRNGEVNGLSQRSYFQNCASNETKADSTTPESDK